MDSMKTCKGMFFILVLAIAAAGCIGQSSGEEQLEFSTLKEAYHSNLSLVCSIENATDSVKYYVSEGNIKVEITGTDRISYSVITSDDAIYLWTSTSQKVSYLPLIGASVREGAFKKSFESAECFQKDMQPSEFQPPDNEDQF